MSKPHHHTAIIHSHLDTSHVNDASRIDKNNHANKTTAASFNAVQPAVYRASTVFFESTEQLNQYQWQDESLISYGIHATPTTMVLSDKIAILEGAKYCSLTPSGLSAISLVNLAFLSRGDEVWLAENIYGPNAALIKQLSTQFGILFQYYNPLDVDSFKPSKNTKLIWLEAAGSITLEFPDLVNLTNKARSNNVISVLDNTWGAGLAFDPFNFSSAHCAVDISVHALTKYPSGGADILMGSICTNQISLHQTIRRQRALHGIAVSGDDSERMIRSLASITLRYDQQDRTTRQLCHWLQQQPQISQVFHPALADTTSFHYWQQSCAESDRAAGLLSFCFQSHISKAAIEQFCDALNLFKIGYSWGGPISLIMLYDTAEIRPNCNAFSHQIIVRLSIGLEHADDLIEDMQQAIQVLID